jgi:DNA polymerase I
MLRNKKSNLGEKEKRLVLLDVHAIIHRAYHALPDFTSSKGDPTGALYGLSAMLIKIIRELKPDYIAACYDLPKPTFRHEAYKEYKAGRKEAEDALVEQLKRSYDIFKAFGIPIYEKEGFEADDIIGSISEKTKKEKGINIIIASGDMDTLQLVDNKKVQVYTLKKGISDTILYDEDKVKERFGFGPELLPDFKGLRGDPSDNIIGISGIGEKTATILIQKFGTLEDMYKAIKKNKAAFLKAGLKERIFNLLKEGKEDALFSKVLAQIRKDAPINFSLSKEKWEMNSHKEAVLKIFGDLGFRSLVSRIDGVVPDAGKI